MEKHRQLTDLEFVEQFENGTFAPANFSHEAHLRLAWIQIHKHGIEQACERTCQLISAFATKLGDVDKFNTTLTIAATKTVYHFMLKSSAPHFSDFIDAFPRLKTHFKDFIDHHYSFDIFNTPLAKRQYLAPDLLPYD